MTEFIRVKYDNGDEGSVPAAYEQAFGFKPLDKPAVDRFGRPLPTKQRASLARSADSAEAPAEAPSRKSGTTSKEK